ncbi:MAG TPA: hypothetical protein VGG56_11380 [Terracidiphilus sp.]|jgi:5-methylcytosine-specific restriction endonuclease McrA
MPEHPKIPAKLLELINSIRNKRARVILDALIKKGSISTSELQAAGYDHPPRAARDVVELGIALKRVSVKRKDGQNIASYVFDERELDPLKTGRVVIAKKERDGIIKRKGSKCNLCGGTQNLQLDHRIPYQVAGELQRYGEDPFQVLDGSCNRKKSWECEHCQNWLRIKDLEVCNTCYWSNPDCYTHVAMKSRNAELI